MDFEYLLNLAIRAAEGYDNFDRSSVGYNGYGFVLQNFNFPNSRKLCNFGSMGEFGKNLKITLKNRQNLLNYGVQRDIRLVGSIKTLVPSLELGGEEILFRASMFVVTTDGKAFPANLYYGPTRLSIGGWKSGESIWFNDDSQLPKTLIKEITCDPFKFSQLVKDNLATSLEKALEKVPTSDFFAIFGHDLGYRLMGISDGHPISIELGETPTIIDIKSNICDFFGIEANSEVFEKWDFR